MPAGFENGRHHVDDVVELIANGADVVDVTGPGDAHALTRAAEVRGDLLGPTERRAEGPGPAHGHVVVGPVGAPRVVEVINNYRHECFLFRYCPGSAWGLRMTSRVQNFGKYFTLMVWALTIPVFVIIVVYQIGILTNNPIMFYASGEPYILISSLMYIPLGIILFMLIVT